MKLDALQLQNALDDMFVWALPHLRDKVTDEQSTCRALEPKDGWRRAIKHHNAEVIIEYSDDRYKCHIHGLPNEKHGFCVIGISPIPKCPILNWRIQEPEDLNADALVAWLVEWAIQA